MMAVFMLFGSFLSSCPRACRAWWQGTNGGGEHREEVGGRLGQEDGEDLVLKEVGQDVDKGHQQHQLSHAGHHHGALGAPHGDEDLLNGHLQRHEEEGGEVDPQRPRAHLHQGGRVVEDADEEAGEEHHGQPAGADEDDGHHQHGHKCLAHALYIARAEVVADDGLGALADALAGKQNICMMVEETVMQPTGMSPP